MGLLISFVFFFLIKLTKDPIMHIAISIISVGLSYTICEIYGFSGVIASVVCGIYFSTQMDKFKAKHQEIDPLDYYKDFWSIIDKLLNYMLYILIGISFVYVTHVKWFIIIGIAAIVFNVVSRYIGVLISTLICRILPDKYKIQPFTVLMTWGGLKGGLCLALAMSTVEYLPTNTYSFILYVTYITIIFTTLIQGLTVGKLFDYLKKKYNISAE